MYFFGHWGVLGCCVAFWLVSIGLKVVDMFTRCCRSLESLRRESLKILSERHLEDIDVDALTDTVILDDLEHVRFVKTFSDSSGPFKGGCGEMCLNAFWRFEIDCFKLLHDNLYVVYAGGKLWCFGIIDSGGLTIISDIYDNDLLKRYVLD